MTTTATTPEQETKTALKAKRDSLQLEILSQKARQVKALADAAELNAEERRYDVEGERRREERRLVREKVESHFDFNNAVTDQTVDQFSLWLLERRLLKPGEPVTLSIYSPGGSVFAGFVMMDAMREARADGVEITAKVSGYAASMGGIILQAATTRLLGKESYLMLHEVATGMFGGYKLSELTDEKELSERLTRQSMKWYADRSDGKHTVDDLMAKIKKTDWWVNAEEALEAGFVDGIF